MSEQPACTTCGMSLPISVSNEKQEPTLEAAVETANFDEELSAVIPSDRNNGIEIRLVLTDCACRRPKLVLENESEIFGLQTQPNDPDELTPDTEVQEKSFAVESIHVSNETENELESDPLNVIVVCEGSKYDEFEMNVCQFWGKNWRQFTSVLPGLLLLLTAGVHIVFTINELDRLNGWNRMKPFLDPSKYYNFSEISEHGYATSYLKDCVIIMWFVGAMLGNMFGAALVHNMKKRSIYYLAAILQILAGILFFLMRLHVSHDRLVFHQMTVGGGARLLSGIVSGLVYLTVTVHASDIASKRMRRIISYAIVMIVAFSTLFYSFAYRYWYLSHNSFANDLISFDFNMIIQGLLVLVLTPLLTNETVPYYLSRGKVTKAQKKFAKLNSERSGEPSVETLEKFDELQLMVREDEENGRNIFGGGNLKPLLTGLSARLLHLFLMNAASLTIVVSATKRMELPAASVDGIFLTELNALRVVVGFVAITLASCMGRHKFFYIGTLLTASGFGGLLLTTWFWQQYSPLLKIAMQGTLPVLIAILSLGLDYYQQKQSADAFTTTKKAWSLATIALFEHLVHATVITTYMYFDVLPMVIVVSICSVALAVVLLAIVPETRKLSLRETRNRFNKSLAGTSTVLSDGNSFTVLRPSKTRNFAIIIPK